MNTTPNPTPSKQTLLAGRVLDRRYDVQEIIGRGGFCNIYKANHVHTGRTVALKVPSLDINDPEDALERLFQEARLMSKLEHPNIARVYDACDGEIPFIALELLHGQTLEEALADHPLPPQEARMLLFGLLEGLSEAHKHKIVHKDLKPANLFLAHKPNGSKRLVLLDFGASSLYQSQKRLTQKHELVGTIQYLPPEYITDHTLHPSMDVYQAALIFVEMLTGQLVINGKSPRECMMMHCHGILNIPDALRHGPLGGVLTKALCSNPEDRYQDAGAFLKALQDLPASTWENFSLDENPEDPPKPHTVRVSRPFRNTQPLWAISATTPAPEKLVAPPIDRSPKTPSAQHEFQRIDKAPPAPRKRWLGVALGVFALFFCLACSAATISALVQVEKAPRASGKSSTTKAKKKKGVSKSTRRRTSKKAARK